jgi:hypothetical protein
MTLRLAAIAAAGGAGFALAGAMGALMLGAALLAVNLVWQRLWTRNAPIQPTTAACARCATGEQFQEVPDALDDVARTRGWDLAKLYAIAWMSCHDTPATLEDLERRYEEGAGAAPTDVLCGRPRQISLPPGQ